jgi:hypothetical protein
MGEQNEKSQGNPAFDRYGEALGKPDESWKLPRRKEGARGAEPTGPITQEKVDAVIDAVTQDRDLKGVEEMFRLRIAYEERQRLAQHVHSSAKEEMQLAEVRIENLEMNLRIIQWNQQVIARYKALRAEVEKRGLSVKVDNDAQMSAEHHLTELDTTLRTLLAFKKMRMLAMHKSEGKIVSDKELADAIAALPPEIRGVLAGKPAAAIIDQRKLQGMDAKKLLADQSLIDAERMLDRQIEVLLSFQNGVPGVRPKFAGQNPVDVFYKSYLQAVAEASLSEELDINANMEESDERAKIIEEKRAFRTTIEERFKQYQHDSLQHFVGGIEHITTGMFDTEHGKESDSPKDWSAYLAEHPNLKGDMEREWNARKAAIKEHRKLVDDVFDLKITDIDDWKYLGENVYQKARFGGVLQLMDALARVKAIPKVLTNKAARTIPDAVVGETATDYVLAKVTFQEEAHNSMRNVRKAWQLPNTVEVVRDGKKVTEEFDPWDSTHWDAIPEDQWKKIEARIQTTREALLKREQDVKGKLSVVESDAELVDRLWKLKHPMDLVDVKPDQELYDQLTSGKVKLEDIMKDEEALKRSPAKLAAVWLYVICEMYAHAGQYAEAGGVLQQDLFRLKNEKINANQGLNDAARDNDVPWWVYLLGAWYAKNVIFSIRHTTIINSIPVVKWGYRLTVGAGYEAAQDARRLYQFGESLLPSSRTARYLNRYAGMKAVEFASDAERATQAVAGLKDAKLFVAGRSPQAITKIEQAIVQAHQIAPTGAGGAWTRADIVSKWKVLKEAGLKPTEIKYLLRNGWCGREAEEIALLLARNGQRVPAGLTGAASLSDDVGRWAAMARANALENRLAAQAGMDGLEVGGRVLGGVALAWQAYVAYDRWNTALATPEIVAQKKQYLRDVLVGNSEKGEPGLGFTPGDEEGKYVCPGIEINLKSLDSSLDAETYARYAEAINSTAGVAILAVSVMAGGPVGLVIGVGGMIIEVVVDTTIGEWETSQKKEFLKKAPAWLLTVISVAGTLNTSSFSMINGLADDEWSDWMADLSKADKVEIRHKLLFSILCEDLGQNAPDAMGDLFAEKKGAGDISFIDTFYKGDFQEIVLPLFYDRLAEQFGNTTAVRWEGSMQLKDIILDPTSIVTPLPIPNSRQRGRMLEAKLDPKTNFLARATPLQIRAAMRDAVVAYMPYIHAARALRMRQRLAKLRSEKGADADETIKIGDREIKLTQVIALLNAETVYGTAENGWKPRKLGEISDADLAKLNIPFEELGTVDRSKLYGQFVQDPLLRKKLGWLYEQDPSAPGFVPNTKSEALAFFALHQQNTRGKTPEEKKANAAGVVYRPELLGGGAFAPQEYTKQRITEQTAQYFARHTGGYGRIPEWEQKLFPRWEVTRMAPNGNVVACPRPLVLISDRNRITTDGEFDHTALASQLMDISPEGNDPYFRNSNLEAVTLDFNSFTFNEGFGGQMPSNTVQATFFFVDGEGKAYTLRRSLFMGQESVKKDGQWTREWKYTRGSDTYYHAAEFEMDPKNRQMREWVEWSLQSRATSDAIARSNERGSLNAEFDPKRRFFRTDDIAEALYAGEAVQPALYLSVPAGVDIAPGSPAMKLLDSVARTQQRDATLPFEANPTVVFVEFELLADGTLTALATQVENMAKTSQNVADFSGETAIVTTRRRGASLRLTSTGYAQRPTQGLIEYGYLRDCPSLLKYFGSREAVMQEAFDAPKRRNQMVIEAAMLGYIGEGYEKMPKDMFATLPSGESLMAPDDHTTILFVPRGSDGNAAFDRIVLHYDDDRADTEYTVRNAYALLNDIRLDPAEREKIIDLYCMPLSSARASLSRVLSLFPNEAKKADLSEKLLKALTVRYEAATDKGLFLRNLFEQFLREGNGWMNEANLPYLSQALPVSLREGAVRVPVTPHHTVSVYLHDDRIIFTPPLGREDPIPSYDFRLAEFTERPDKGYNFSEIQDAYKAGKPVTLVVTGRNPIGSGDVEVTRVPLNLLTRQRDVERARTLSAQNEGSFVQSGEREYRRANDLIQGTNTVLTEGVIASPGVPRTVRIEGNEVQQYGPHAILLREIDRSGNVVRLKYMGNALQLWEKWGRKLPQEMTTDERAQYEKELAPDARVWRESNVTIDRWAVDQLTAPVVAERGSEAYNVPARRIVELFPSTYAQVGNLRLFRSQVEEAYSEAADPKAFLTTLYRELEQTAKGKPIAEEAQWNVVRKALGMPEKKEQK